MSNTELEEREINDFSKIIDASYSSEEKKRLNDLAPDKANTSNDIQDKDTPFTFRREPKMKNGKRGRKKFVFLATGVGGGGILVLVIILAFLASTLKIQNLAQHVLEYNMASVSRSLGSATEDNMMEKFIVDGEEDVFRTTLRSKLGSAFSDFRSATWGKFDTLRPAKIVQNLQQEGRLEFVYTQQPRKFWPGTKLDLSAIRIDGADIDIANIKTGRYFSNLQERGLFGSKLEAGLAKALPDTPNLIRGRVARRIQGELGVLLKWWEKLGIGYKGKTENESFRLGQQEAYDKIASDALVDCNTPEVCDKGVNAKSTVDKEVKDGTSPQTNLDDVRAMASGAVTEDEAEAASTVLQAIRNATANSALAQSALSIIHTTSGVYQIALPLCIIYDASLSQSMGTIDSKSAADQRAFYALESAADQQKTGDTSAEAVGAMNNKLGNISTSIPEQRAYNRAVDTTNFIGKSDQPQNGGVSEDISIVDVLGSGPVADFANAVLKHCDIVLSWQTAIGVTVAQIVALIVSGGGTAGAEASTLTFTQKLLQFFGGEVAAGTADELVTQTLIRSFTSKAKDLLLKVGRDAVILGGVSLLAKMLVLAKMGGNTTGLETDASFANRADVGGNLHANDLHRQALMGRSLTPIEQVASRISDQQYLAKQRKSESIDKRYFALENSHSLASRIGFGALGFWDTFTVNRSRFFSRVLNIGNVFSIHNIMGSLFPARGLVFAATNNQTGNYGIIQWGWSNEELALIQNDISYSPVINAELYERSGQKSAIEARYASCFTDSIGKLLADGAKDSDTGIIKNKDGTYSGRCSPEELGPNNTKGFGDGVFRYRLAKRNEYALDHMNDIQNATADPAP